MAGLGEEEALEEKERRAAQLANREKQRERQAAKKVREGGGHAQRKGKKTGKGKR